MQDFQSSLFVKCYYFQLEKDPKSWTRAMQNSFTERKPLCTISSIIKLTIKTCLCKYRIMRSIEFLFFYFFTRGCKITLLGHVFFIKISYKNLSCWRFLDMIWWCDILSFSICKCFAFRKHLKITITGKVSNFENLGIVAPLLFDEISGCLSKREHSGIPRYLRNSKFSRQKFHEF